MRELRLGFELLDERARNGAKNGDRLALDARYRLSLAPRSRLTRDLESWLARPLTPAERRAGFDFTALLGRNARLELGVFDAPGREWRGVLAILPAFGPDFPPNRAPAWLSLAPGAFDVEAFARLPDWLRDRILASPTFAALTGAADHLWPAEHVRPATLAEKLGDEIPW